MTSSISHNPKLCWTITSALRITFIFPVKRLLDSGYIQQHTWAMYWIAYEGRSVQSVSHKRVAQNTCVTLMLQDSPSTPIINRVQRRRRLWTPLPLPFLSLSLTLSTMAGGRDQCREWSSSPCSLLSLL